MFLNQKDRIVNPTAYPIQLLQVMFGKLFHINLTARNHLRNKVCTGSTQQGEIQAD